MAVLQNSVLCQTKLTPWGIIVAFVGNVNGKKSMESVKAVDFWALQEEGGPGNEQTHSVR